MLLSGADRTQFTLIPGNSLKVGSFVIVEVDDTIPSHGAGVKGVAPINEAAITGESAPGDPRIRR